MRALIGLAAIAATLILPGAARAWPDRPVTIISNFGAGSPVDLICQSCYVAADKALQTCVGEFGRCQRAVLADRGKNEQPALGAAAIGRCHGLLLSAARVGTPVRIP